MTAKQPSSPKARAAAERRARLARELRANLGKRKRRAKAIARASDDGARPEGGDAPA